MTSNPTHRHPMNTQPNIHAFDQAAQLCAMLMLHHALYIQKELPSLELGDDLRQAVQDLCDRWVGAKHDVVSQLCYLSDIQEEGAGWDELQGSSLLILRWLDQDLQQTGELVDQLAEAGESLAWLLVIESATQVIQASNAVHEAIVEAFETPAGNPELPA